MHYVLIESNGTFSNESVLIFGKGVNEIVISITPEKVDDDIVLNDTIAIVLSMASRDPAAMPGDDAAITIVASDCKFLAHAMVKVHCVCIVSCDNWIYAF